MSCVTLKKLKIQGKQIFLQDSMMDMINVRLHFLLKKNKTLPTYNWSEKD